MLCERRREGNLSPHFLSKVTRRMQWTVTDMGEPREGVTGRGQLGIKSLILDKSVFKGQCLVGSSVSWFSIQARAQDWRYTEALARQVA